MEFNRCNIYVKKGGSQIGSLYDRKTKVYQETQEMADSRYRFGHISGNGLDKHVSIVGS